MLEARGITHHDLPDNGAWEHARGVGAIQSRPLGCGRRLRAVGGPGNSSPSRRTCPDRGRSRHLDGLRLRRAAQPEPPCDDAVVSHVSRRYSCWVLRMCCSATSSGALFRRSGRSHEARDNGCSSASAAMTRTAQANRVARLAGEALPSMETSWPPGSARGRSPPRHKEQRPSVAFGKRGRICQAMHDADIAVVAAGTVCWELAYMGCPLSR